ncbi:uncharacterized protein BJ212DRAFT_1295796 [Suillus subaureus]|uniref:Uncharacterized protein n=1 Tax=Suillus subaureus TaxID=48587 RepID=A0A9P7JIX2_9AGAM|nr:uncharacterized protein BJ212DRAFT_1295796 [Suillus subaureus]KAG1824684.1 hypothetical protein BJ212DRAFT_1295796 [Suillus subaureus]
MYDERVDILLQALCVDRVSSSYLDADDRNLGVEIGLSSSRGPFLIIYKRLCPGVYYPRQMKSFISVDPLICKPTPSIPPRSTLVLLPSPARRQHYARSSWKLYPIPGPDGPFRVLTSSRRKLQFKGSVMSGIRFELPSNSTLQGQHNLRTFGSIKE